MPEIDFSGLPDKDVEPVKSVGVIDFGGLPDREYPTEEGPVLRPAPDIPFLQKTWESIKERFRDPEKEAAQATLALVDAENLGISPDAAFRLRYQIDKGVKEFPEANLKRSTTWDRLNQRWERGMMNNDIGVIGGKWLATNDDKWLLEMDKMKYPSKEETYIPESRLEDVFGAAAELLPLTMDIAEESGWRGVTVGAGFATIAALAGQPELIAPSAMAGLSVGMTWGAVEGTMMREGGLAVHELRNLKDKEGNPLSRELIRGAAWGIGSLNSVLEVAGFKVLLKSLPGGDRIFKDAIFRTVKSKALKDRLTFLALEYGKVVSQETAIELAQESNNIVFEELAKHVSNVTEGTEFQTDAMEIVERLKETGLEAAKGFAVIAAPGITVNALTAQPEVIKEIEDTLPENIKPTYEAEKARALARGEDNAMATQTAIKAVMETPEVKERIEEIKKAVPEEAIPSLEEAFRNIIEGDLTEEEMLGMLDIFAEGREIIEEVAIEPVDAIRDRLIDLGMPEEEAVSNAALYSGFNVMAKRAGVPVQEIVDRYLPEISREVEAGPEITEADRRAVTDNVFLSEQITDEEQLADVEQLRTARDRISETLSEQEVKQTVTDDEMRQIQEAVDFLDTKIETYRQATQEGLGPEAPRGRIKITPDGINIDLLRNADQSTFVHETGHLYYKMLSDLAQMETASEELKADNQTIREWLGVKDGDELTIDQQEQFARGFEAYLREGKAPTPALKKAFENFKKWLMEIYRSLSDLDVELTDDVRGAMDRMFIDEGMEAPVRGEAVTAPGVTVRDADGVTYDQEGQPVTNTPAFRAWFGDSKIVDEEGNPLIVHHGGLGADDIEIFESDFGGQTTGNNEHGAFHFTDDLDVAEDYGRQAFIRRYQDDPESLITDGIISEDTDLDAVDPYALVDELAEENIGKQSVYIKIENPIEWDNGGERVDVQRIEEISQAVLNQDYGALIELGFEENIFPEPNQSDIEENREEIEARARDNYGLEEDENIEDYMFDEAAREVLDEFGLLEVQPIDGIIIRNMVDDIGEASNKIADQFIVFDPTHIKSKNNRGTFSAISPNIFEQAPTKTTFKEETEPTFSPREITSNPVPADILENPVQAVKNYLPSHAEKGQYFYMTANDLQAHLDKHGDGFLYRVGDRRSVEGGFERGKKGYLHKFATENKKTLALNTSLEGAKKYLASSLSPEYNIIYRIMPQDLADDFIIHIPSNEAARNEGDLIIHSPKPASTSMARVLYSQGNFIEESEDVSRRAIEERRAAKVEEGAERAAGVRVRPGVAEGRPERVGAEAKTGKPVITRNKEGEVFYQSAFHGTPHKFDKFTLDHIGKGEGAQAYGWGLYFAENKDVAQWYREKLSAEDMQAAPLLVWQGKEYRKGDGKPSPEYRALSLIYWNQGRTISQIKKEVAGWVKEAEAGVEWAVYEGLDYLKKVQEVVNQVGQRKEVKAKKDVKAGALLRVELAPKADEWLDWDKPLSDKHYDILKAKQDEVELKNLEAVWKYTDEKGDIKTRKPTGEEVYGMLVTFFKVGARTPLGQSPQQAASLFLRDAGIPGIRYLDATSRGKEKGTFNYVVFDESLIEIQEFLQAPKKAPSKITNIRQLAKSLGGIDYNRENLKGELRKLIEDAPATRYIINRKNQGVPLDRLLENAIEAGFLSETATLDDLLEALKTNLKTPEAIQAELEKEERAEKRIEEKAQKTEDLRKAFVEMAKKARKAYKEGKDYATVKEARKLKNILARARKIRIVRDYFNLTDAELKSISRKNPLLLSQYEFKLYLDDVRVKAMQLSKLNLEKASLINMIHEKDLRRVDNYRRALGFPVISKMTLAEVEGFANALEPFHEGDTFLSERELETVDRTDLKGIATWREAKERLAEEIGVSMEELEKIKVKEWDDYRWDTALAEANPFYKMLVTETTRKLLEADFRFHEIENEVFRLARKSEKSRGRKLVERAIPQDSQIMEYLETPVDERDVLIEDMTPEQVEFAHYMESYFSEALEYLIKTRSLERGRENYFVHMRRSFLESVKEEGIVRAFKDLFKTYQEDEATFNILDEDTGNILPLEKFFQFALQRTGGLEPTRNVTKAFLVYAQTLEKKKSLDELIPKMDIYAQSITPEILTPRGLEADRSIKKFVNKYINNKKGRRIRWIAKQGGTIDVSIRGLRTFTTLLDLGLNIPSGVAAFTGEQVTNFEMLGMKGYLKGTARMKTKQGKKILKKYEAFVGRSAWEEFRAPGKQLTERISDGIFGLFHEASVKSNAQFLLGAITDEEFKSGELSTERLANLKIEMGRFRVVPGTKSLVGSTSAGSAMMQYKTWAAPIIRTISKDITTLLSDLAKKPTGEALTSREAREIYRLIGVTTTAILVGSVAASEEDDETFIGQVIQRVYRESMTLLQGVDPEMWGSVPRVMTFMKQLLKNIKELVLLEEYKTKPGLKGVYGLQKQLTPRAIKQILPEEKKKEKLR